MIDLGETTNLSSEQAASSLARFMNVMGTSQDKVSNLGSAVVELGNNYATTEAEIVEMSQRLSGAAKQVGLTEGETLGLAAALSSVGIEAEAGGSAISKVMIDIAASIDEGGERAEQFAKVAGLSADEFARKWKTDPGAALAVFVKGLANAEDQGTSTLGVLADLGITEVRMRDALLRSAAASDQFTEAMNTGNEAFRDNNALAEEAAKRYDTTASKIAIAKNNIIDAAIGFGEVFLPAIQSATEGVSQFASGMSDLPEGVQGAISVIGFATGAVLLMGGTMLLAVPKIAEFKLAQQTLAAQMPKTTAALKGTTAFLGGPWGLAIGAAVLVIGLLAGKASDTQARIDELSGTLDENTGAVTENSRVWAASKIAEDGGFVGALKEYGLSLDLVTDASLGNAEAMAKLKKQYDEGVAGGAGGLGKYTMSWGALESRINGTNGELDAAKDKLKLQKELMGDAGEATDANAEATESAADAYIAANDEASGMLDTLTKLIDTLNEANGVGQDAVTANMDHQQALADLDEQISKIAAGTEGYSKGISDNTQAGRDNKAMLVDLAAQSQDAAKAQFDLDGNTANYKATLEAGRQAVIDRAIALGATADEAQELADKIYAIPSEAEFNMIADTKTAAGSIDAFVAKYTGVRITAKLFLDSSNGDRGMAAAAARYTGQALYYAAMGQADGGKVNFYANGGRENHIAQFARAGTYRVWAEDETGGEYYVPMAPSKRPRSLQIASQMVDEMGYQMIPKGARSFANGSPVQGGSAHSAIGSPLIGSLTLQSTGNTRDDLEETLFQLRRIARGGLHG